VDAGAFSRGTKKNEREKSEAPSAKEKSTNSSFSPLCRTKLEAQF
jgi:hypothetical protein